MFLEELYGILEKSHKETGHGGRDRMIKHLNNGYANISRDCIELFLSLWLKATSEAFFDEMVLIHHNTFVLAIGVRLKIH
jgi:hypothetical protein